MGDERFVAARAFARQQIVTLFRCRIRSGRQGLSRTIVSITAIIYCRRRKRGQQHEADDNTETKYSHAIIA